MARKKIILFLFIVSILSGFFWNQKIFGEPITSDQLLYDGVAMDILNKGQFTYEGKGTFVEPLYPLFLSGLYKIFGHNYDAVRIIQIIIFSLTIVIVYFLAREFLNPKIAIIASVILALFYGLAGYAGDLLTETLFIFFIVIFVYGLYKSFKEDRIDWLVFAGIILGLATLTKVIVQFLFILIVLNLFVLYFRKFTPKKAFLRAGIFLICFFAVVGPWLVVNKSGAVISEKGGKNLLARAETMENLSLNYPGHFIGYLFGYHFAQKLYPEISSSILRDTPLTDKREGQLIAVNTDLSKINEILGKEGKEKFFSQPGKYLMMSILDFISFNSPIIPRGEHWRNSVIIHPMFVNDRHVNIPPLVKSFIILSIRFVWFLFLFLTAYALAKNIKNWQKFCWLFLVIFYFNLTYSSVHAIPRYALPIYPVYTILAFIGLNFFIVKINSVKNKFFT